MADDVTVTYNARGPLFDGSFSREMARAVEEIDQEIGDDMVEAIQSRLDQVLVNPTGFYRSQIKAHPVGQVVHVDDSNVVYGPWLEGVGKRNRARPGFPGYHTFRDVFKERERQAPRIAEHIIARYVD